MPSFLPPAAASEEVLRTHAQQVEAQKALEALAADVVIASEDIKLINRAAEDQKQHLLDAQEERRGLEDELVAAHYFATVFANAVLAKEEQLKEQAGKLHVQEELLRARLKEVRDAEAGAVAAAEEKTKATARLEAAHAAHEKAVERAKATGVLPNIPGAKKEEDKRRSKSVERRRSKERGPSRKRSRSRSRSRDRAKARRSDSRDRRRSRSRDRRSARDTRDTRDRERRRSSPQKRKPSPERRRSSPAKRRASSPVRRKASPERRRDRDRRTPPRKRSRSRGRRSRSPERKRLSPKLSKRPRSASASPKRDKKSRDEPEKHSTRFSKDSRTEKEKPAKDKLPPPPKKEDVSLPPPPPRPSKDEEAREQAEGSKPEEGTSSRGADRENQAPEDVQSPKPTNGGSEGQDEERTGKDGELNGTAGAVKEGMEADDVSGKAGDEQGTDAEKLASPKKHKKEKKESKKHKKEKKEKREGKKEKASKDRKSEERDEETGDKADSDVST